MQQKKMHGTTARYRRHIREGTVPCFACTEAQRLKRWRTVTPNPMPPTPETLRKLGKEQP